MSIKITFKKKEIFSIIITSLILAFIISLLKTLEIFLYSLLAIFLVIITNILAKKITAYYYDFEIEVKLWKLKRYGYRAQDHFQKELPIGIIFPFLVTALTIGRIKWMACLVFEPQKLIYRVAKRHGEAKNKFSEITEFETGIVATLGIIANILIAIIGIKLGFPEFAKLNIFYAFYNVIPFSDLDGTKIFFANRTLWAILTSILIASIFLVI